MKIKKFDFPMFEEWKRKNYETQVVLGAYRCEIRSFSRSRDRATYMFAVSLSNLNPLNIYTDKLFCKTFEYVGDNEKLKQWYNNAVEEFHAFWKAHIKSTYFE